MPVDLHDNLLCYDVIWDQAHNLLGAHDRPQQVQHLAVQLEHTLNGRPDGIEHSIKVVLP